MNTTTTFENINTIGKSTRFATAMAIILIAMNSFFAGGTVAFVSVVGIATAYALLAIIGWCPFVAVLDKIKSASQNLHHGDHFPHGHHAA